MPGGPGSLLILGKKKKKKKKKNRWRKKSWQGKQQKTAPPPISSPLSSRSGYATGMVYVVIQFYPWFKFSFLLFLGIVMYDNEFETRENKIWTKDKIEPQQIHV